MMSGKSSNRNADADRRTASLGDDPANSAEFLRNVVDGLSDSLVVIDRSLNVVFANRTARELLGDISPAIRRMKCHAYLHDSDTPCDGRTHKCPLEAAVPGKTPIVAIHEHLWPDGAPRPVEIVATPMFDENGRMTGVIEVCRDISERGHAAAALCESERKWRSLVENAPISIAILDLDGVITYANRVKGLSGPDQGVGTPVFDYIAPAEREKVRTALEHVRRTGTPAQFETRILADNQPERILAIRVAAIAEGGEVRAFMTTGTDVTARTRAERELDEYRGQLEQLVEKRSSELEESRENLRRAEQLAAMGAFAAGIAHEINNPLASILMTARHALRTSGDPHSTQTLASEIIADTERCARIVKGVLQFAKPGSSERWAVNLNEIVRRAVDLSRRYAERRGVRIIDELGDSFPTINANPVELEQAVVNLLNNAIEASSIRQTVRVRTECVDGAVRVIVRDDGCGMSEVARNRAFDPFFTTRTREGGVGLGLSIVHGTVTGHGGTIHLKSRPHGGTTFTIELPVGASPTAADIDEGAENDA